MKPRAAPPRSARLRPRRSSCPISYALDILGDRWTLLIVRDLVFSGKRMFGQFLQSDEHIATNILTDRLGRLVCAGVLQRDATPASAGRSGYRLTERGLGLVPLLLDLVVWGARNDPHTGAPPEFVARAETHREEVLAEIMAGLSGTGDPVRPAAGPASPPPPTPSPRGRRRR